MERWTTSPLYPLTATALGVLATLALLAAKVAASAALAVGLALFAAALSLRNWWVAEEERPLLAEELLGIHDDSDAMRHEADELRERLSDLGRQVERAAARSSDARAAEAIELYGALSRRISDLERRQPRAEPGDAGERLEPPPLSPEMRDRVDQAEARAQKLAQALSLAVREMRRQSRRLDVLEARARGQAPAPQAGEAVDIRAERRRSVAERRAEREHRPEPTEDRHAAARDQGAARDQDASSLSSDIAKAARLVLEKAGGARANHEAARVAPTTPSTRAERFDPDADESGCEIVMQGVVELPGGAPRYLEALAEPGDAGPELCGRRLDNFLLARSLAVIDELDAMGRDEGVFCNVSLDSLRNEMFLRSLLLHLERKPEIARRLVFELSQLDIDRASEADVALLQGVREKGFAFSLDHVFDWSADIARLARIGFQFVKLDCGALLQRVAAAPGAAERLMASFDRVGLTLVVENIETEDQLDALRRAGARFGQGPLLAPRRRVALSEAVAAASAPS